MLDDASQIEKIQLFSLQKAVRVILHRETLGAADCSAEARPKANVDQPATTELCH